MTDVVYGGTEKLLGYCRTELMTAAVTMNGCVDKLEFIIPICATL